MLLHVIKSCKKRPPSIFLKMSKVVTEEVAAGRLTVAEARSQLAANATIAHKRESNKRFVKMIDAKISAWDNELERRSALWTPLTEAEEIQ